MMIILNAIRAIQKYLGHNDVEKWEQVCTFERLFLSPFS